MILLRSVQEKDFADIYGLAAILDSVNLPHDRQILHQHMRHAIASFRGREANKAKAIYLFVAEDLRTNKVIGTSSIFARHGADQLAGPDADSIWTVGRDYRVITINEPFRESFRNVYGVELGTGEYILDKLTPDEETEWRG